MKIDQYKDILEINRLATEWIAEYKENDMGEKSPKLEKQYKEMRALKAETDTIKEERSGEFGDMTDWKSLYAEIQKEAKSSPLFAICFGNADDLLGSKTDVNQSATLLAIKLKKMASAWFGQFGEEVKDDEAIAFVTNIYDQAQKVIVAPKEASGDMVYLEFYGSDSKQSRKMTRTMKFMADEYAGIANVSIQTIEDDENKMQELGLENLPAVIFKRGDKKIATHQGLLSTSALQGKVNLIIEGGNITDSSSVATISDMKSINKKELYSMGEFLLFYFEASWCGASKRTTPVVEKQASAHSNVKFEKVMVDGSHSHHKALGVTHVPCLVFVRDGIVIGKHIGYINPSTMSKKMDLFAVSKKRTIGVTKDENCSPLPVEEQSTKIKTKDGEEKKQTTNDNIPPKVLRLIAKIKKSLSKADAEAFERKIIELYTTKVVIDKSNRVRLKTRKEAFINVLKKNNDVTTKLFEEEYQSLLSKIDTRISTATGGTLDYYNNNSIKPPEDEDPNPIKHPEDEDPNPIKPPKDEDPEDEDPEDEDPEDDITPALKSGKPITLSAKFNGLGGTEGSKNGLAFIDDQTEKQTKKEVVILLQYLNNNPDASVTITGSVSGSAGEGDIVRNPDTEEIIYDPQLPKKRAGVIAKILTDAGISKSRITIKGIANQEQSIRVEVD